MNKSLMLKVYDVDYSFIIKNYLDPKLWEKEWTIFVYKKFQVILRLSSIDVRKKAIDFNVVIHDNNEENQNYFLKTVDTTFSYNLNIENINILKKRLCSNVISLIERLELNAYIELEDDFLSLNQMQKDEKEKLKEIAEKFLDDENVTNEEIREAYIDYYIDKNEEVYSFKNKYRNDRKYNILTDFYLIFLEVTQNNEILEEIKENIGQDRLQEVLKEIKEYKKYMESDEFNNDMQSNLESI